MPPQPLTRGGGVSFPRHHTPQILQPSPVLARDMMLSLVVHRNSPESTKPSPTTLNPRGVEPHFHAIIYHETNNPALCSPEGSKPSPTTLAQRGRSLPTTPPHTTVRDGQAPPLKVTVTKGQVSYITDTQMQCHGEESASLAHTRAEFWASWRA